MSLLRRIQGLISTGAAVGTTNPLLIGGKDTSNNLQVPQVNSDGAMSVQGFNDVWRHGFGYLAGGLNPSEFTLVQTGSGQTIRSNTIIAAATWTRATTTATITSASHGMVTNDIISISITSDELAIVKSSVIVTVTDANTFTITCLNAGAASGTLTYTQDYSALQIALGTTPNSESVIETIREFSGTTNIIFGLHLSQRIANQEVRIGLYKKSATLSALAWTRVTTVLTVTSNAHGLAPGQEIQLTVSSDTSAAPLKTYVVESVTDANTFTITCLNAGAASGTLSYFSYNSAIQLRLNGTSATTGRFETYRNGWNSPGTNTITTTVAASGTKYIVRVDRGKVFLGDISFNNDSEVNLRAIRDREIPDISDTYTLMIRTINLGSAPATNTTLTISFIEIQRANEIQVNLLRGVAARQEALQTITRIATNTVVQEVGGDVAHDIAVSGNPVRIAGRALTTNYTAVATGDTADLVTTLVGALVVKLNSIPENSWNYAAASGGISNTTTAVTIKAAAAAGIRNYITSINFIANGLSGVTELAIRDGAGGTVLWRMELASGDTVPTSIVFSDPLKSTAATLLEVVTLTAVTGKVYFNANGHIAP